MRRRRPIQLMAISILLMVSIIYLILNFPPTYNLSFITYHLSLIPVFLTLVFLFIFSLVAFLLNNKRRGFLVAVFVLGYFILKLMNLTHPFFIILLLVLLTMLELLFAKRK